MTGNRLLELPLRFPAALLLLLGALLYLPNLGNRDLWYPDEPDIGEVAQAMYRSGDWIVPRRTGDIWIDYPPMVYWAGTAASHLLGGMSELSLRLPIALAALALVLVTWHAGRRWFDEQTGLWAGLALLTFPQFSYEAVCYRPDMLFSLFIASGMLVYASAFTDKVRWGPRLAGFALLGLAVLSKGPLGLLLPGLVLTLWHGARREWRRILELAPPTLVAIAVALPWYLACADAMGLDALLRELQGQNLARFAGAVDGSIPDRGHIEPFYYYLARFWIDLFPWFLALPSAVVWLVRSGRWRDRNVQLALWWLGTFFVFLSIAATKRQLYILPAHPAAALLLGPWLAGVGRTGAEESPPNARHLRIAAAALAVAVGLLGLVTLVGATAPGFLVSRFDLEASAAEALAASRWPALATTALMLPAAAWLAVLCRRRRLRALRYAIVATFAAFFLVTMAAMLPAWEVAKSYRAAGAWLAERLEPQQPFGLTNGLHHRGWRKRGGLAYYSGRRPVLLDNREEVWRFLRRNPTSLVLVYEDFAEEMLGKDETTWRDRIIGTFSAGRYRYLAVAASPKVPS